MRILGIDPGYDRLGIAVIEGDPSKPSLVWSDCFMPAKGAAERRLSAVAAAVTAAIGAYAPDALSIETLFFNKSASTALGVAQARGVVLATAGAAALTVIECSPQTVKLAVTGYGAADKKAIALMVPKLIILPPKQNRLDDELDAIAVGIAGLSQARTQPPPENA